VDSAEVDGPVQITEARGFRARRAFLRLPWQIYKGDRNWVPPLLMQVRHMLDTRRHPFYRHSEMKLFIARNNGRPAGRIAAIICRPHNEFHGEKVGFFGFFECIDDRQVACGLLDSARAWLAGQGMTTFRGPVSPSTNYECGLLVDGFDLPPAIMMPYNPPWYPELLEAAGLRKAKDTYAYYLSNEMFSDRVKEMAAYLQRRSKLSLRRVEAKDLDREIEFIRSIYNSAWEKNWGFVPVDDEEFGHLAGEMKQIFKPELALIGFVDGQPAGFAVALPNINEAIKPLNGRLFPFGIFRLLWRMRKINSSRLLLLGVKPEFRKSGLDILMYASLLEGGRSLGYGWGELSWILEDNHDMRSVIEKIGGRRYKTYRFYEAGCAGT